jgi:hypothetical protein
MLDLGPDRLMVPIYGSIWRAILGGADFSMFLYGHTGVFKTEVAALVQQHFGSNFDARRLPTLFISNANANEVLAFSAKDAVLAVDELAPPEGGGERDRVFRDADRLLRSQGNQTGAARCARTGPAVRRNRHAG